MENASAIPWKRIAVESIAIVASILLAFGIDAWWDERVERSDEKVLLTRLSAEFSTNLDRIDQVTGGPFILNASSKLYGLFVTALNGNDPMWNVPVAITVDTEIKGLAAERYARVLDAERDFDELRKAAVEAIDEFTK